MINSLKTIDGFDAMEVLNHLENGGTMISEKRGDIAKFDNGKFLCFFFIGNKLSNDSVKLNLDYLSTFKLVGEPMIEPPVRTIVIDKKDKLPLTMIEVEELAVKTLDIYHIGWEMDNVVWVMRDGSMFSTNHGQLCLYTKENLAEYIKLINTNLINCSESLKTL